MAEDTTKKRYREAGEERVEITRSEYDNLLEDRKFLRALEAAGVDSWEGYEEAQANMEV
jgi:hypothetical protein